ncbi:hypothetical protein KPH14_002311 [Odynerus spinipes]|uniref:Uncharacterized protein n=1 Tax=Odynerus spinipes TaxID=1348599 RepID=A0AAD9RLG6_9HYME|nr:hypothetical protein KPH14_002311 [Odynerus spinipes]
MSKRCRKRETLSTNHGRRMWSRGQSKRENPTGYMQVDCNSTNGGDGDGGFKGTRGQKKTPGRCVNVFHSIGGTPFTHSSLEHLPASGNPGN